MADQYIDSMLGQGETILAQGRQHWMALIRFALQPIIVFLAAIGCFILGVWLNPSGDGLFNQIFRWIDTLLGLVTAGLFILAIAWFPLQCIRWVKRRYLITDRRVLYVEGWLRRNSMDAGLSMITDVTFRQTFLGRHMGFADLVIATAANRPLHFRDIRDAIDFKKAIMAAQQGTVVARADKILEQGGHAPVDAGATAAAVTTEIPASVAVSHEPPPRRHLRGTAVTCPRSPRTTCRRPTRSSSVTRRPRRPRLPNLPRPCSLPPLVSRRQRHLRWPPRMLWSPRSRSPPRPQPRRRPSPR